MKNHGGNGKMKRKRLGGGTEGEGEGDELEEQSAGTGNLQQIRSGKGEGRSIYFVVNILIGSSRAVASLYKVGYPYPCSPTPSPRPRRLHPVARMDATAGITYVPLHTRSRSRSRRWIVAISARRTTVFDADTEELLPGPDLLSEKECPALVSVEDKIYALSTFPQIKGERDLEPWFEVLDLSTATVVDGRLQGCSWEELPSPPCFPSPSRLAPHELRYPPMVTVHSYVLVGSYLLMSLKSATRHATHAFHTVSAKWQTVDDRKSLPFVGRATPHDAAAGVYLGESSADNRWWSYAGQDQPAVLTAYCIKLLPAASLPSSNDDKLDPAMKLSITGVPVKSSSETTTTTTGNAGGVVVKGIFCSSLHNGGSFCSLNWRSRKCIRQSRDDDLLAQDIYLPKKAYITLKTYQMDEDSSLLQQDKTTHKIAITEQPEQEFKIHTKSGGFVYPDFLTVLNTFSINGPSAATGDVVAV
ncbi:hypothetical protein ACQJBY_041755 [Aegilops geniculata]